MTSQETAYLFILTFLLIQVVGFFIFLDLYFRFRRKRFQLIVFSFLFNFLSLFLLILSSILSNEILLVLVYCSSEILATLGLLTIVIGVLTYFTIIDQKIVLRGVLAVLLFFLLPFLSFDLGIIIGLISLFTTFIKFILLFTLFILAIKWREKVYQYSKSSFFLMIITTILKILSEITIVLLESEILTLFNYSLTILLSVMIMIFLIHLEHNVSVYNKNLLKDKYSHNLAQILQLIVGNIDLYKLNKQETQIEAAFDAAFDGGKLLERIREL